MHAVTQPMPVPFLDLTTQYKQLETEWLAAIRETGNRGSFVLGPNTQAFEKELAEYVGGSTPLAWPMVRIPCIQQSLRALGVGPGDEVITTPFTFFASAETIDMAGATPVFADIRAGQLLPRSREHPQKDYLENQSHPAGAYFRPSVRHGRNHAGCEGTQARRD